VLATSSRITDDIYRLTLADAAGKQSTTTVTGNHRYLLAANDNAPLLALAANDNGPASGQAAAAADATILRIEPGGSWKIVRHLTPGDRIRTALNGAVVGGHLVSAPGLDTLTVVSVTLDRSPRRVHNLEVSNLHSFAVGELGAWTHNTVDIPDLAKRILDWIGPGGRYAPSKKGAPQYISCDNKRQIRFDITKETSHGLPPHINVEPGRIHIFPKN
jgi:hypothetical protein